jgi:signal transduction histidine kinase
LISCRCDFAQGIRVRDRNISVNLYRIAQEAVNNILKHAQANQIAIRNGFTSMASPLLASRIRIPS